MKLVIIAFVLAIIVYTIWLHRKKSRIRHFSSKVACVRNISRKSVEKEIVSICDDVKNRAIAKGVQIWGIKPWFLRGKKEIINADAGFFLWPIIEYTPSWIAKAASTDPSWRIAFLHTLGHEIGHRDHEPPPRYSLKKKPSAKTRFVNYVRECRCDFYGIKFVMSEYPQYTREEIVLAKEKASEEMEKWCKIKRGASGTHPSWKLRIELLKKYHCFDDSVIQHIAKEINFADQQYIDVITKKALLVMRENSNTD